MGTCAAHCPLPLAAVQKLSAMECECRNFFEGIAPFAAKDEVQKVDLHRLHVATRPGLSVGPRFGENLENKICKSYFVPADEAATAAGQDGASGRRAFFTGSEISLACASNWLTCHIWTSVSLLLKEGIPERRMPFATFQ